MLRYILAAALVSIVSGCVTSDPGTPYSQSAPRAVQSKRTAQATAQTPPSAQNTARPVILGAAY